MHRVARSTIIVAVTISLAGCGESADQAEDVAAPPPPPPPASDWLQTPESVVLELSAEDAAAFDAAVDRARSASASARDRFTPAAPGEPDAWFVLVELPVRDGTGGERLWIAVDAWSPHRIEGRLTSPPTRPLRDARAAGDTVAVPARALLDWLHRPADSRIEEGGFTIDALEARRGPVDFATPTAPADE